MSLNYDDQKVHITNGADMDGGTAESWTALMYAARNGRTKIVQVRYCIRAPCEDNVWCHSIHWGFFSTSVCTIILCSFENTQRHF